MKVNINEIIDKDLAEFTDEQLSEIYAGLNSGIHFMYVKLYAKPNYSASLMREVRESFLSGVSYNNVLFCLNANVRNKKTNLLRSFIVLVKNGFSNETSYKMVCRHFNKIIQLKTVLDVETYIKNLINKKSQTISRKI